MTPSSSVDDFRNYSACSVVIIPSAAALFDCPDICFCITCFRFETMEKSDPTDNDKGKRRKKLTKEDMKAEKKEKYQKAVEALKSGQFPNPSACARHFEVCAKTLRNLVKNDRDYIGGGRKTVIFTGEEENKLKEFVSERISLGCGLDFHQLCLTIQELIGRLRVANPDREFPDWDSDYPPECYARRFMKRHQLVLRRTMALSNARAMLTTADLDSWFSDVSKKFFTNPKFSACFQDPRRIYNQDETAITWGNEHQKVLAPKGYELPPYNIGGSSREHTTASVMVGADGSVPAIRIVWAGKRFSKAELELQESLPSDGVTGKMRFSKSESGYVTRDTFLEILSDLNQHLTTHNIVRPVLLFVDGYGGHLGLAIAEYCLEHGIQLVLLRANMTHVLQPLGEFSFNNDCHSTA